MMLSSDIYRIYGKYGINYEVLRYARNCGRVRPSIVKDEMYPKRLHFEYDNKDVRNFVRRYRRWRKKCEQK